MFRKGKKKGKNPWMRYGWRGGDSTTYEDSLELVLL